MVKPTDPLENQISIQDLLNSEYPKTFSVAGCDKCICKDCLYWWSERCPYGECYDDRRAKEIPYEAAHPDQPPRTGWSNWREDQNHWCRGGVFYPQKYVFITRDIQAA